MVNRKLHWVTGTSFEGRRSAQDTKYQKTQPQLEFLHASERVKMPTRETRVDGNTSPEWGWL
jgi:hypothetical protein